VTGVVILKSAGSMPELITGIVDPVVKVPFAGTVTRPSLPTVDSTPFRVMSVPAGRVKFKLDVLLGFVST
jgi:hypothetical protein